MKRRLFLVGVPRSGTTLLQSLLAAHSEVTSFTESHLLSRHFSLVPIVGRPVLRSDPSPRAREFLVENGLTPERAESWSAPLARIGARALQTESALREIVGLFDRLAEERGSGVWLEKTPRHLRFLPQLEAALDEAQRATVHTLHMVRRPLETVASLHRASQDWPRAYGLEECAERWNRDVAFTLEQLARPRQHLVLYEELCERPEAVLRALLSAIGLDWQQEILAKYAAKSSELVTADETWKAGVERPLVASTRSARELSETERAEIVGSVDIGLYERAFDLFQSGPL